MCGGTDMPNSPMARKWGLSPRVRGNPEEASRIAEEPGSIPACAGEP